MTKKFGLIHQGNDEAYGLVFVDGELNKQKQFVEWFDGDSENVVKEIVHSRPDFICFSPLTTFFDKALAISRVVKEILPNVSSVFGGPHVFALPECIKSDYIDIIIRGPVYGTIDKIINSFGNEIIQGTPIPVSEMIPVRHRYFEAVPRIANRHRKYIMSHFGCVYNCSYCSTSNVREFYGSEDYRKYCLNRRPIENLITEARSFLDYNTEEVSLEDDDILFGNNIEEWLEKFSSAWKKEIKLPTFANVTPLTVMQKSNRTLEILSELVNSVQMGVQVVGPESLKLFNRLAQSKKVVESAYKRLSSFSIPVKMEFILGLPIEDPVEDAIASIKMAQELGAGYITAFPLMLYPGTKLTKWCKENSIELNENCTSEWHTGIGSIKFDQTTDRRIKNLTKMATFFVKYNISERWIRCLIDMDITEASSRKLSECQYLESLIFRMGKDVEKDFDEILTQMDFKY